jgi:hypothetical protein
LAQKEFEAMAPFAASPRRHNAMGLLDDKVVIVTGAGRGSRRHRVTRRRR